MSQVKKNKLWLMIIALSLTACKDYSPKPNAYPRIEFPNKIYESINSDCPFSFEIPRYSQLRPARSGEDCWFDLHYIPFDATLHLSYRQVHGMSSLDSLMEDSYQLAFKHISRAEEIIEKEFSDSNGNYGMIYDLEGRTATPFNFYLTDKKNHFIRGSFYFNKKTNRDSVAPIYNFLKKDIYRSIKSLEWKN